MAIAMPVALHDPYLALGLHRNPFVAEHAPGVPDALWVDRGLPAAPAPSGGLFVQVIGPCGAGKTSLLLHWRQERAGPYHYVPPGPGRWRPPPIGSIVYWDELDRMPEPLRVVSLWRAAHREATVIAGTHVDLAALARRCGFAVQTVAYPPILPSLLRQWAERRIAAARVPGTPCGLALGQADAGRIAAAAGHSWRIAADLLHIWAAERAREVAHEHTTR